MFFAFKRTGYGAGLITRIYYVIYVGTYVCVRVCVCLCAYMCVSILPILLIFLLFIIFHIISTGLTPTSGVSYARAVRFHRIPNYRNLLIPRSTLFPPPLKHNNNGRNYKRPYKKNKHLK